MLSAYDPSRPYSVHITSPGTPVTAWAMAQQTELTKVKVKVILRPMVNWPVCPGIRPPSGTCNQFRFVFRVFIVGCPLWWEDRSVISSSKCYWALPALSLSSPSLTVIETISYCLISESSLFVASYDSQGHGVSILTTSTWVMNSPINWPVSISLHRPCRKHCSSVAVYELLLSNSCTFATLAVTP
jgi:hypothetical protein